MLSALKEAITEYVDAHGGGDGAFATEVPGLALTRASRPVMPHHRIYRPTICVVVQGAKQIMTGDRVLDYGENQLLIVTVEIPASGQIVCASRERPYLGLNIDFDPSIMREVMDDMDKPPKPSGEGVAGVFVQDFDAAIGDCVRRLIQLTETPKAVPVLARSIMREICYWLLMGPNGSEICKLALPGSHTRRMTDAIYLLREHFAEPVRIEQLAAVARMSPSSFHQHFKTLTSMTPLQYQKHLRLLEARRLMVANGANVASAAYEVGYESASQFSREYTRMFGIPPKRDVSEMKGLAMVAAA
jgi:AraC-like DNA-binding protein